MENKIIKSKNNHIEQYLNYYIKLGTPPEYAVMLRGEWGSGKSWFIKKLMKEFGQENFLYVSLYGVTSYKEIETSFFQQVHPFLSSKGMKIAGQLFKGLVKTTIKFDWNDNGKEDGNIQSSIPDINLLESLKKVVDRTIVFDDLERCSIAIPNILGYINQLVENNGLKVIIIANENQIITFEKEEDKENSAKSYLLIKEKLIGKSFDIITDFDAATVDFISQTNNLELKELLEKQRFLLKELFHKASYNNLRHLRQAILDFERFFDFLPFSAMGKPSLLNHILRLFFCISFELKKGIITENDFSKLFILNFFDPGDKEPEDLFQTIRIKYFKSDFPSTPIAAELWEDFFKKGIVDKENLKQSIESSLYYEQENTPNWKKLLQYYDFEDEEFQKLFESVYKHFFDLKIDNKHELLQIVGMLITFSNENLIPVTKEQIIEIGEKNVLNLKKIGAFKLDIPKRYSFKSGYHLGSLSWDTIEVKNINKFIVEQEKIVQFEEYSDRATSLLDILTNTPDTFIEKVILPQERDSIYYNAPILAFIKPEDFAKVFLRLPNKIKKTLGWHLEERYSNYDFDELYKEMEWLECLYKIVDEAKEEYHGKISYHNINIFLASLQQSIKKFEE